MYLLGQSDQPYGDGAWFLYMCVLFNVFIFTPIGALVGHLAKNRAQHGAALGFLFGIFGIVAIMLSRDNFRRCQHCLSVVPEGARVCAKCSRDL